LQKNRRAALLMLSIAEASMQQRFRLLSTRDPEDWAKSCVVAIARGKVPATTIKYQVVMNIQQFNNLKKIVAQFGGDYQMSSNLYDRR
jgi:hypothetical protein